MPGTEFARCGRSPARRQGRALYAWREDDVRLRKILENFGLFMTHQRY